MKILSWWKHHYVAIAGIFLVSVALTGGMVGCTQPGASYTLTIASTAGGSVTPGVGTHTYNAGTTVNLAATPALGHRFGSWTGSVGTIANVNAATTTITMNGDYSITANFEYTPMVAAGASHTVGLKSDGTVVAVGDNSYGELNVTGWTNIIRVAAGAFYTVGLKSDGTVVTTSPTMGGNVSGWTNIIQVAAGGSTTVGICANGTVVAAGYNTHGELNVGGWTDIVQVAAGPGFTLGRKSNGTVVAVGDDSEGQRDVSGWGIVQVAAGYYHTVGLKSDGTVVTTSSAQGGNVSGWTNIIQVAAGGGGSIDTGHTVGLKSDRTVVAVGDNSYGKCTVTGWTDIVQVAAGYYHTVGLKSDGTVVAVGDNSSYSGISGWDLG